jgi:hypothetical protein
MKPSIVVLAAVLGASAVAEAGEIMLTCTDTSETMKIVRESFPTAGIDTFRFDPDQPSIRQTAGTLRSSTINRLDVTDSSVSFEQDGMIQTPALKERFATTISRADGRWVRTPKYLDSSGARIFGEALKAVAAANNLDGLLGVSEAASSGHCVKNDNKF